MITAFSIDGSVLDYEELNETVPEGTVLNLQCDSGYSNVNYNSRENFTCNSTGSWSVPVRYFSFYCYSGGLSNNMP